MKTLRHFSQVCLLAFGALGAAAVSAQEFKIGFVNTDRIFREASTAKSAQAKLEQEFSKREKIWSTWVTPLKLHPINLNVKRPHCLKHSATPVKSNSWTKTASFNASAVNFKKT